MPFTCGHFALGGDQSYLLLTEIKKEFSTTIIITLRLIITQFRKQREHSGKVTWAQATENEMKMRAARPREKLMIIVGRKGGLVVKWIYNKRLFTYCVGYEIAFLEYTL